MNAIFCRDVSFSYQNEGTLTPILHHVDLQIAEGEFVAIQGPSGSGKSTLLYLLGLLSKPDGGEIRFFAQDTATLSEEQISSIRHNNIGFVFQQFHLLPKATVLENILLPLEYSPKNENEVRRQKDRALELAERFGLSHRLNHRPNELSGGQQQRVAIARALLNAPDLILADEPTGNLDSNSAQLILEDLKRLNRDFKKTVIIITHDNEVAKNCNRIIHIKDGSTTEAVNRTDTVTETLGATKTATASNTKDFLKALKESIQLFHWREFTQSLPRSLTNIKRQKLRSFLTMLGITVGVAAVFSMITLGQFTKEKILAGFSELGVNTVMFYGYRNWDMPATTKVPAVFAYFNWERDLQPLTKVFPEIEYISPLMIGWNSTLSFAGRTMDQDVRLLGVNGDALQLTRRKILTGRNFLPEEITHSSGVCILGYDIAKTLFRNSTPMSQVIAISQGENTFGCRVIGVLESIGGSKEYMKPNSQVILPYTFFRAQSGEWWSAQITQILFQVRLGSDPEQMGKSVEAYFYKKYGESGHFSVDSDTVLITQMNRFLTLFTVLLTAIALVTLSVGGMGITNMMLVSVSERYREIGLRRALGATPQNIRLQFLSESILVCTMAGFVGLLFGFVGYSSAIWAGTKFMSKLNFEWILNPTALGISFFAIFSVGLISGLFPALKAERLQVIEALRSD